MENIIREMIGYAYEGKNYVVADLVYKLLSKFAYTCNCPSNWRSLGEQLAEEYKDREWIVENCKLYDFK